MIAGRCFAAHALKPNIRIFGVEPDSANDSYLSLKHGEITSTPHSHSIADGLLPTAPGQLTFPIMQQHLASIVLVTDEELAAATRFMLLRLKLLVEPSGAASIAALLTGKVPGLHGKKIGVILSGGNVDPGKLAELLTSDE